jgi:hypothetical protein
MWVEEQSGCPDAGDPSVRPAYGEAELECGGAAAAGQTCRLMQRVRPQIVAEYSARLLKSLFARPGFCPSPSLVIWSRPLGGNHVCQSRPKSSFSPVDPPAGQSTTL